MKKIALALSLILNVTAYAECVTAISCPTYCGGLYGGASWVYLQPDPSDYPIQIPYIEKSAMGRRTHLWNRTGLLPLTHG
jgi:hypothetical protein